MPSKRRTKPSSRPHSRRLAKKEAPPDAEKKIPTGILASLYHPSQLDDYAEREDYELVEWANTFCKDAGEDAEDLIFAFEGDPTERVVSTIQLVCDLWPYVEDSEWLSWQRYKGPRGKGPWFVLDGFEDPWKWTGAQLYLWHNCFEFDRLFMASEYRDIIFQIRKRNNARITSEEHHKIEEEILSDMGEEYMDYEFEVTVNPNHGRSPSGSTALVRRK